MLQKNPLWKIVTMAILAFLGMVDSGYLTYNHFSGTPLACGTLDCDTVTSSVYATIGGVPVALIGFLFYALVLALIAAEFYYDDGRFLWPASLLTVVGFLASARFVYLQLAVIKAICVYCMFSAGTSTGLFAIGLSVIIARLKRMKSGTSNEAR